MAGAQPFALYAIELDWMQLRDAGANKRTHTSCERRSVRRLLAPIPLKPIIPCRATLVEFCLSAEQRAAGPALVSNETARRLLLDAQRATVGVWSRSAEARAVRPSDRYAALQRYDATTWHAPA
jgi:hypothetical protein